METKTYVATNPEFQLTDHIISEGNRGRVTERTRHLDDGWADPYPMYQLRNGERWFTVPKEVYDLWLAAYQQGCFDLAAGSVKVGNASFTKE